MRADSKFRTLEDGFGSPLNTRGIVKALVAGGVTSARSTATSSSANGSRKGNCLRDVQAVQGIAKSRYFFLDFTFRFARTLSGSAS